MNKIVQFLLGMLSNILTGISPEIRELFGDMINTLEAKAKATPNPVDDIFVSLLKNLLGF